MGENNLVQDIVILALIARLPNESTRANNDLRASSCQSPKILDSRGLHMKRSYS